MNADRASAEATYLAGIVEGFYGVSWSWSERRSAIDFLRSSGLNTFVYAPKSDPHLRRCWSEPWPAATFQELEKLSDHCRVAGIKWGIGLSPFEAYLDYGGATLQRLKCKLTEINALSPDILCILFDDMRGDVENLATLQAGMVHDIAAHSCAERIIMCPTYYSTDPVLQRVFGAMPENYWTELGRALDPAIDFFWTGDRVCSDCYSRESLAGIAEALRRPPVLWDNYPVNDGEKMCRRLHLQPFCGRPPAGAGWTRGHLANPMNQAWLSRIALCTMPVAEQAAGDFATAVRRQCPEAMWPLLERDRVLFSEQGLDGISAARRAGLLGDYRAINHPAAREVVAWLQGEYAFDPACLTD